MESEIKIEAEFYCTLDDWIFLFFYLLDSTGQS